MTALSGKYKKVFVGRILKKVEEDGQEVKGLVRRSNSSLLYSGVLGIVLQNKSACLKLPGSSEQESMCAGEVLGAVTVQ